MNLDQVQLVIVRGLPGSGKSTLAKEIAELGFVHYENDQYFMNSDGEYHYNPAYIGDAIRWCERATRKLIEHDKKVVVSNTFIRVGHMQQFMDMVEEGRCLVIECMAQYGSTHGVPAEVIERMASDWEDYPGAMRIGEKQPA